MFCVEEVAALILMLESKLIDDHDHEDDHEDDNYGLQHGLIFFFPTFIQ
jgi:hypothetical protein